ncbi:sterol desaturase family protein [Imperialibacter roseus]|uniref:Sterol desaturase family protein n=1 Tax=Imperialibacter roseus TaxID=1324217 RepID=A0ABZ0IV12_9BACT|nr:sterol desaturase family protein [Imperialibacter roseus]WOK08898.1 sterol desaturase family protein [Imperialibacter roseus]
MNINPVILSIPIYFLLIGVELIIQHFQHRKIYRLNDALTNMSCGITQQITGAFLKVLTVTTYQLVYENFALFNVPVTWYTFILIWLGVDLCYYWAHRMSHEINLFWGGHVVHHQSEDYNFSVALRQGSFQVFWTFFFYLPLAIIGVDTLTFVLVAAINTVYQFWIHTETIGKLGWFEYVFNTPSHHRVHHGRDPKYIDKNHGGTFIIWDRLFGTFQEEEERPTYGITKPVNTWNPIKANLQHYVDMAGQLKKVRSLGDGLRIMFNKPGWLPDYLGGYQGVPDVDKSAYRKFNLHPPSAFSAYLIFQYLFVLGGTSFFMFNQGNFSIMEKSLIAVTIVVSIIILGGIIEMREWAFATERIRQLIQPLLAYFLTYSLIPVYILGVVGIASLIWMYKIRTPTSKPDQTINA